MKLLKNEAGIAKTEAMKVNINYSEYQRSIAEESGRYKPIAEGIEKLKSVTSDIPWDNLYDALDTGDLRAAMGKYWSKRTLLNWEDVDVRNEMHAKFNYLPTMANFPKEYVERNASGEFYLSLAKIYESNKMYYERTIEPEQVDMINQLCDIITKLKLNPYDFKSYIGREGEKAVPNWNSIASVVGHR